MTTIFAKLFFIVETWRQWRHRTQRLQALGFAVSPPHNDSLGFGGDIEFLRGQTQPTTQQ